MEALAIGLVIATWLLPPVVLFLLHVRSRRPDGMEGMTPEERVLSEQRSGALLRELLDEREYQQLKRHGYVEVASPSRASRVYRIPALAGRVRVYEHGRAVAELCVLPTAAMPANDLVMLHKLMIVANEQDYLARANELPLLLPPRFYA